MEIFYPKDISGVNKLLQENADAILYFYNDGCAPCFALRPKIEKMILEKFPLLSLFYMNAMEKPEIAAEFMVFASPVILVCFDGREYRRYNQFVSIVEIELSINRLYSIYFG
ncbi:MAG: thioredoxin family protein [Bacteroidales bacterium]|nr:thioredoxin family protein [Bacteroidales bacterium]